MKQCCIIIIALFSSLLSYSQSTLWKITGNELEEASYLFGTIHIPSQKIYALNDSLLPAIEKVDLLLLELNMEEVSNPLVMMQYIVIPGEKTLKDYFTEEEYDFISLEFEKLTGQEIALFQKFKPFVLLTFIAQTYFNDDDNAPMALDEFLNYYALLKEVKVKGIETIEEQMAVFDKMPNSVLIESLSDSDSMAVSSDMLLASYLAGDLEKVAKFIEEDKSSGSWMDELLGDRNTIMFNRTASMLQEGNSLMIAVGCGHLAGSNGLIVQYRNAGYTVEPIISKTTQVSEGVWEQVMPFKKF